MSFKKSGLGALTRAQLEGQWNPLAIAEQVNPGAESAPGAASCPDFPPPVPWESVLTPGLAGGLLGPLPQPKRRRPARERRWG